jgi:hypothetical protein
MMGVEIDAAGRKAVWLAEDCAWAGMLAAMTKTAISAVNPAVSRGGLENAFKIVHPLCGSAYCRRFLL